MPGHALAQKPGQIGRANLPQSVIRKFDGIVPGHCPHDFPGNFFSGLPMKRENQERPKIVGQQSPESELLPN